MRHLTRLFTMVFCLSAAFVRPALAQDEESALVVITPDKPFFLRSDSEMTFTIRNDSDDVLGFRNPMYTIYSDEQLICEKSLPTPTPTIASHGTYTITWDGTADEDGLRPRNAHYRITVNLEAYSYDDPPRVLAGASFDVMPARAAAFTMITNSSLYEQGDTIKIYAINRTGQPLEIDPVTPFDIVRASDGQVVYTHRITYVREPDPFIISGNAGRLEFRYEGPSLPPGVYKARVASLLTMCEVPTIDYMPTGSFEIVER